MGHTLLSIISALFITLGSEGFVYFFFTKTRGRYFYLVSAFNLISNLLMNVLLSFVFKTPGTAYYVFLGLWEILTTAFEGLILFFDKKIRYWGFLAAILANVLSYGIGCLFNYWEVPYLWLGGVIFFTLFVILAIVMASKYRDSF